MAREEAKLSEVGQVAAEAQVALTAAVALSAAALSAAVQPGRAALVVGIRAAMHAAAEAEKRPYHS